MNFAPSSSRGSTGHLVPGQRVGRFRLLSLVASGGMAQIWAAKPETGGFSRTVALKVIRPEYAGDEEYRRMLIDEAAAAAAVHHPNVCEIFELGEHEHVVFIAMEWVPGDSIAGLIRQRTQYVPFNYALAARVIADACAGLHAAHLACGSDGEPMNIVHRDISPQNILLSSQGHVKVTDFGIAKARDQLHAKTRTGEIKGKFAYIAAEQILGQEVDHRSDIYAMGCVLYVTTLGLRPFGRGNHAVMSKIVKGDFTPPRDVVESYPPGLEEIVIKALARQPSDRYETAEDMRLALEHWLNQTGKIVTHSDIARAVSERLSPKVRDQIQALRSANRFTPRNIAARVSETASPSSWEVPTAARGLAIPKFPATAEVSRAEDNYATQPSISPAAPAQPSQVSLRESTETYSDDSIRDRATVAPGTARRPREVDPTPRPVASPAMGEVVDRQLDAAPVLQHAEQEVPHQVGAPSRPHTWDPRRTALMTVLVTALVILSFFAGRL